ncbi:hypothetical protein [Oleidesulfovibrio alaskensis]|uniref:hypothetical protein n=1 Tax=Oleidesulfovibrio alaskensis TaxID=58180 RepID=UPI000420DE4C|nr:hypothetical protein [Oleidesulfovibrio alaskensis]
MAARQPVILAADNLDQLLTDTCRQINETARRCPAESTPPVPRGFAIFSFIMPAAIIGVTAAVLYGTAPLLLAVSGVAAFLIMMCKPCHKGLRPAAARASAAIQNMLNADHKPYGWHPAAPALCPVRCTQRIGRKFRS